MKYAWQLAKFVKQGGILGLLGLMLAVAVNAQAGAQTELMVSAAISLKDVFTRLATDFEQTHPAVKVFLNFAASGQLLAQIENDAPVDLFISAGTKEMDALAAKGLILSATRVNLMANQLVLITNAAQPLPLAKMSALLNPEVRRIALGNPDSVPAGRYAQEALTFYQLYAALQPKLVFGENVRQVLDYVARGEVDAGLVYATDAKMEARVKVALEIPPETHKPILYPAAVITISPHSALAHDFLLFLDSPESQAVFQEYGFMDNLKSPDEIICPQ